MERETRQRDAIKGVIEAARGPLSPGEILGKARVTVPALGIATIYRNLKALVAEGVVQVITLPGDSARYETTQSDHHHHFQCTECDRVYDIPGCPGNLRQAGPARIHGPAIMRSRSMGGVRTAASMPRLHAR